METGAYLLRVFPSKAVLFSSNNLYRRMIVKFNKKSKLSVPESFLAGGLAGMTAISVTYPIDSARGRISRKLVTVYRGVVPFEMREFEVATRALRGTMPYVSIQVGTVGFLE